MVAAKKKSSQTRRIIGKGAYRTVFEIDGRRVGKELKGHREKNYGPIKVRYPMKVYSRLKFGIGDLNKHEFKKYQDFIKKVPRKLRKNFGQIEGIETRGKKTMLVMRSVKNFDGSLSKSMAETGPVKSKLFWQKIDQIEKFLLEERIPFFNYDINIMVQQRKNGEAVPVVIDFKRIGARTYPFKPHLLFTKGAMKRVQKLFARLRKNYKK